MYANKNVRKSKYTYSNRFVIRETLANYQYSDDIISFMLRETKINENMFSIIKYYQTDALSFMQAKTNKVLRYHIYNEIYNVYLFHNDIKGLFKRAKMDRLKQFEVRRVLLLCEYSFVNRYINKEEKLEDQTLDELLELKDANNVRIDNLHMHNDLSEKLIMEVKHEIMSFNKNLSIKNQNDTLYYYFENQIIALLRETWDRTLFEVFNRVFDEFCAEKHERSKDCDKYYRRKLDFIVHSLYLKKISYKDLKHIAKHLKLKKRHKKIIVKKGMNAKEIIRYFERYKDVKVLLYFAERKYNKKVYALLETIGIENEITRKVRNAHADKGGIIFSTKGYGINRVDTTKTRKECADSSLAENEDKQSVTSPRNLKVKHTNMR